MAYVYGIHAVDTLLRRNPRAVQRLWLQRGRADKRRAGLSSLAREQGVEFAWEDRAVLDALVQGRHQGAVAETIDEAGHPATANPNQWDEKTLLARFETPAQDALILVLDGVTDPHNLGACLRSADAAGVDAVVAPRDRAAGLTPVVRKVACGAAETVPFVQVTNLHRVLGALKSRGFWIYGTDGDATASLYETAFNGPVALVMGAEGGGMRRLTREACDVVVRLPMAGVVDSLNVSVATGVALFEIVRQRGALANGALVSPEQSR